MTTVGYGDIIPVSKREKVFAIVIMSLACGVFAYTVGSIGNVISKRDLEGAFQRERLNSMNKYMKLKEIPRPL